ncbi:3-oxoacyl-[acyl-carrier-protein] synthase III C-terminal domain-containing protein [Streptomyces brevispora]|uniref:3-oxoacyl-[acyl-carrier-protein] synthase III C-terminal domain-containing protein n=1 Tax=Streptomyces brevispora TaxID=887462 RepID=UPI0035E2E877
MAGTSPRSRRHAARSRARFRPARRHPADNPRTVRQHGRRLHTNTGSASIPVTLDAVHREGLLAPGDRVPFVAFGGGMNLAASPCTWTGLPVPSGSSGRISGSSGRGFSE